MTLLVYGIPNCSTCKKALTWLEENNVNYQFINTKEHPPSKNSIENWVKSLGIKSMRNTSGLSYRALGEEKNTWTQEQWIDAFAQDAMLLKRPLFVKNNQGVLVGFRANETVKKELLCN
ncbi:Spx/MgsR family RNA polymerase-binding regulatory protein [Geminocystis sp. NIES-3709]|uniref:Spx/MgsR family RNA polymerase-binding regulatory protein n=1 Tax=Geminocystis sp. NIES-3709 TaxID=1617448 RepID=UPI0005FC9B96|nr:Spx/MgsR family RNA polymerase-binding regulatory protein [Geminocystis sp. NIES-3709]BAQ63624.1 arsenate reductase [Geminocystis sp. NIES-3709]